jgi:hypothetical protein
LIEDQKAAVESGRVSELLALSGDTVSGEEGCVFG